MVRTKIIATDENSVLNVSDTKSFAFCCHMLPAEMPCRTHQVWLSLTQQRRNDRLILSYPDDIHAFLEREHTRWLVQVICVLSGSYHHYTKYFVPHTKADGSQCWVDVMGMVEAELSIAGFMLLNDRGLDCVCERGDHNTYRYLVNFWMKSQVPTAPAASTPEQASANSTPEQASADSTPEQASAASTPEQASAFPTPELA